jgi:hypothetical protein
MTPPRFFLEGGTEISRAEALFMVRPLDAVGATSRTTLAAIIRAWTAPFFGQPVITHWEQVLAAAPIPVDLSAEPEGLIPRRLARLFHLPGSRGEVWRCEAAAPLIPKAAELLARWAAQFSAGYDIAGAIRSADAADRVLGPLPLRPRPRATWCSQSVFLFSRTLGPDIDIAPGYDAEADPLDPRELHELIKQRAGWARILRWE